MTFDSGLDCGLFYLNIGLVLRLSSVLLYCIVFNSSSSVFLGISIASWGSNVLVFYVVLYFVLVSYIFLLLSLVLYVSILHLLVVHFSVFSYVFRNFVLVSYVSLCFRSV